MDCQGTQEKRFGIGMAMLLQVEHRQLVEAGPDLATVWSKRDFPDGKRASVQSLSLSAASLSAVETGNDFERVGNLGVVRPV